MLVKRSQRNSTRNLWNSNTGYVRSGHVLGIGKRDLRSRGLITRVCHVPPTFRLENYMLPGRSTRHDTFPESMTPHAITRYVSRFR